MKLTKLSIAMVSALIAVSGCTTQQQTSQEKSEADQRARQQASQKAARAPSPQLAKERKLNLLTAAPAQADMEMIQVTGMRAQDMIMAEVGQQPVEPENRENYQDIEENSVKLTSVEPVSTFSIDVDTGSYSNIRRMLNQGYLPPSDAVRIEEMLNYFNYGYEQPSAKSQPFSVSTEVAQAPWNENRLLMRIGVQGYEVPKHEIKSANLVFLLDVSGSMNSADKLPLLKSSLQMLVKQLDQDDSVAIVVYAGASGVVLEPTSGDNDATIIAALNQLEAGGSTNGGAGIELAYSLAQQSFKADGINRVILATDGDFNVGTTNQSQLVDLIKRKREQGIALTTLGFGRGNYNDYLMEQLADEGNGHYAYIDNLNEARKVLVDELSSSLEVIAKDVKIQVEFNPNVVAEYRLLGYENRALNNEDFNNDKVDAGELGAGHNVTAIYELALVGSKGQYNDARRYADQTNSSVQYGDELANVKLRYKMPNEDASQLVSQTVTKDSVLTSDQASSEFKFASAVAGFGQLLKQSDYVDQYTYQDIIKQANNARGQDEFGYRAEFVQLVRMAETLQPVAAQTSLKSK